ncbi:MAG: oxidoreductase [Solirubrobacteraceae bacterium]
MPSRVPLGRFHVNRLGFGAMQLPGPGVFGPPRDHDQAIAVVRQAVMLGVDHIDTAQFYGPNVANELLHEALHPFPDDLALVSKVGARRDDNKAWLPADRPDELRSGIEDNLRTLGVQQLAAVNLRLMDPGHETGVSFDDQLGAMAQARDDGLIGAVGLSNVSREQLLHALDTTPIACVQNPLNVVDRASLPVLHECAARGIAFVPFFPLGSAFDPSKPVLSHPGVTSTAQRLEVTASQVALAWLLALSPSILLIPGTSSLAHLAENLRAGEIELDAVALAALDTPTLY